MKKINKRVFAILVVMVIAVSVVTGCETSRRANTDKITISIGNWPTQSNKAEYEKYEARREAFMAQYSDIEIVPDEWKYDTNSFAPKASSNQLPTMFNTYFTEVQKIIDAGYAADVTEAFQRHNYITNMNDTIKQIVSKDGKFYAMPLNAYVMGLMCNINLFKQAGLINENGTPIIPRTFDELAETAKIIKEKTGMPGFAMSTMNNAGGWHFMNIAWNFGVKFIDEKDGKYVSCFDSNEAVEALQFVKDLKWKYNVLPSNAFIDNNELRKTFATDQAAMCFATPPINDLVETYAMSKDSIALGAMPEGPKGHYTLLGGNVMMISRNATPEQIEACLKWLSFVGNTCDITEESKENIEKNYRTNVDKNFPVGIHNPVVVWTSGESGKFNREMEDTYRNINQANFKGFESVDGITIKTEESICCQQLYKILDSAIQAVLTDENSDPEQLMKKAASDFQKNYLDEDNN